MRKTLLIVSILFLALTGYSESQIFFGNIHAHTSYSDGVEDPWEAYLHARQIAKLDIQGITDHCHYLRYPLADGSLRLPNILRAAEELTEEGKFLAIGGFEWTLTGQGHITVYDTQTFTHRDESDLYALYDWIYSQGGIGSFAHPGVKYGDYKDFEYYPKADQVMQLIEVGNGSVYIERTINAEYIERYRRALSRGWHVGATVNQDNHEADWGSGNDARTGFWMEELTVEALYKAMRERHTFGSEDSNAKVYFYSENARMGDILYDQQKVQFTVEYEDVGEKVKTVQIIDRDGITAIAVQGDQWKTKFSYEVKRPYEWLFIRIEQEDGNEIITSPIWIQNSSQVYIFNTFTFPEKVVKEQTFKFGFEIANLNMEKREMHFEIREENAEVLFSKEYSLVELGIVREVVDIRTATGRIGLYLNDTLYENVQLNTVSFIAGLDTTHENYFVKELEPLAQALKKFGGETIAIKGSLNATKIKNCNWLILPLPPSDAMMPSFAVLSVKDIPLLKDFIQRGGNLILVLSKNGSTQKTIDSFNGFLKEVGIPMVIPQDGKTMGSLDRVYSATQSGSKVLYVEWGEATDTRKIAEIIEQYQELWK